MPGHASLAVSTVQIMTVPMPDDDDGVMACIADGDVGFRVGGLRHVDDAEDVHFTVNPSALSLISAAS